jgi:hypothetical protein
VTDHLKDFLSPADDGRAFTDAVLHQASGALHRRRAAAGAVLAQRPAWEWLAEWARPWLVGALVVSALVTIYPATPWSSAPRAMAVAPADSDVMNAAMLPAEMAIAAATDVLQER